MTGHRKHCICQPRDQSHGDEVFTEVEVPGIGPPAKKVRVGFLSFFLFPHTNYIS